MSALGSLEIAFRLTPNGGEPVVTVSTPAMFALADEFADTLRALGGHTDQWINSKFVAAIAVQAMQAEGLAPAGELSLGLIAAAINICDFEDVSGDYVREGAGDAPDPTPTGPDEGRGAGPAT